MTFFLAARLVVDACNLQNYFASSIPLTTDDCRLAMSSIT
jgi:hypothetical protein